MPLQVSKSEFEAILVVMARFPDGAPIRVLLEQAELSSYKRRTLQRRLDHLLEDGRLVSRGGGRGFHYALAETPVVSGHAGITPPPWGFPSRVREDEPAPPVPGRSGAIGDWLSTSSRDLRAAVTRPVAERPPAPYNDRFLNSYQPNVTQYLAPSLRLELAAMGRVGMEGHPAGTYLRKVMGRLIIDLSWNSSRLEGNTYSILETERLLELGENAEGRSLAEAQMILNHKVAIEILADQADEIGFNRYTLFNLHAALAESLLPNEHSYGRLRHEPVGVSGTSYRPLQDPARIEENFARILAKTAAITDPFEQAFFTMVQLPYLQPFIDVNKRVSRLAANIPLMLHNLCPLAFVGVPREDYILATLAVYELNRVEYLRDVFVSAYRKSCDRYSAIRQVLGEPDPLRVRYRRDLTRYVKHVVESMMDKKQAARWIADESTREIDPDNHAAFIEMVETSLTCLHEGNIARFRLRPATFHSWFTGWR